MTTPNSQKDIMRFQISEQTRKVLVREIVHERIFWTLFFAAVAIGVTWFRYLWPLATIVTSLGALGWMLLLIRGWRLARTDEWGHYEYELDSEGILQLRPSGARREFNWQDAVEVSINGLVIYFKSDGSQRTSIVVDPLFANNPTPLAAEVLRLMEEAGKLELVTQARKRLLRTTHKNISNSHRTPRWRWHLYAQTLPMFGLLAVYIEGTIQINDPGFLTVIAILSIIGASAVEFLWCRNLKRLREFERMHPEWLDDN